MAGVGEMEAISKLLVFLSLFGLSFSQYNVAVNRMRNCEDSSWKYYAYKCYKISSAGSYDHVRDECQRWGADLTVFDTRGEWYFLQHIFGNQIHKLGLRISDSDVGHRWVDGKLASETYTRWHSGEPNNILSNGYTESHSSSYWIFDDHPGHHRAALCEKRANHHDSQSLCASQEEIRSKSVPPYNSPHSNSGLSFEMCAQSCLLQHHAYSAVVDGACLCIPDEPTNGTCMDVADTEKIYYEFTTTTTVDDFDLMITQPANMTCDDPKHTYYDGSCYVHQTSSMSFFHHEDEARSLYGPQAKIVSINSEAEARFIDEVIMAGFNRIDTDAYDYYVGVYDDRNHGCEEGWVNYDGGCFHYRGDVQADQATQRAYCQNLTDGADLVWFEDSNDRHYAMDRIMPADAPSVNYQVWSGLMDITEGSGTKTWRYPMWNDNSGYQPWRSGEGSGAGEHCVVMRSNSDDYGFIDYPCTGNYAARAVCRYNPRERDSGSFHGYVNTDGEWLNESYSRWVPNHGVGPNVPYCAYHHHGNRMWYQCNCQDGRPAMYEYPAKLNDFTHSGSDVFEAFTPIEARFTHDSGAIAENSVDFGYYGQHDWDSSYMSYTHVSSSLGVQEVTWDSRDFWYQRSNGSATYETVLPMSGISLTCPMIADTANEMECEVAASGQSPSAHINFDDGTTADITLQDSSIEVVGPDLSRLSYSGGQETTNYANVMYNSLFNQPGLIQAFEYDAVQKGSFHFVVWRPRCSADQVFCSKSMACHAIDYNVDVCESANNVHKTNCGSNKWSLTARACVDSNGNTVDPTRRYHGSFSVSTFDNVGEFFTSTQSKGRRFVRLQKHEYIEVKAGDVLGFIGLDGKLADYHRGVAWTAHSSQGDKAWFPQSGVGHWNYEFYLNAFFSSYRHAVVSHTYSSVGENHITLTTSDSYLQYDLTASFNNTVYELVDDVQLSAQQSVIKNMITTFQVNDHPGYPVTYEWDFADGSSILTEPLGQVNHSFSNTGRYNVTVRAYNELSQSIGWADVLVQARINEGTYWQYDNSTQLGHTSVFRLCIDDGNEVTYSISVGDGSVHSGKQVFEENPNACKSGWHDRNSQKCYLYSSAVTHDNIYSQCASLYDRAFPAYYDSMSEYSHAWHIWASNDWWWGYHRVDGVWYDTFKRVLSTVPNSNAPWYPGFGPGTGHDAYDCITHYDSDGKWVNRACSDTKHVFCMYEGRCETFSIDLSEIGTHDIVLRAENEVSSVEESFTQYILTPIQGLTIDAIGPQIWGDTIVLEVSWTSGSMITATCYNSASSSGTQCSDFDYTEGSDGLAGTGTITIPVSEYETINDHSRTVKLVNKIGEMEVTQSFTVMYNIQGLSVDSTHDCAITAEDTITYTLTAAQMSHSTVEVTFADQTTSQGSDIHTTIAEMTDPNGYPQHVSTPKYDHTFDHEYPVEGTYTLTVNTSNAVSHALISRNIVVENPIRGFKVRATGPTDIWPGQKARVFYTLEFDADYETGGGNSHLKPTDVTKMYYYGHPDCSAVQDEDECLTNNGGCSQICVNTNGSYYCTCDDYYYLQPDQLTCLHSNSTDINGTTTTTTQSSNQVCLNVVAGILTTPDMWSYLGQICPEATHTEMVELNANNTDIDAYDYEHYGTFNVTMHYSNCISDKRFTFTIDVDEPVINLTLVSDDYILPWSTNSTLSTTMVWGSRLNLTYDFNDTNSGYEIAYDRLYPNTAGHMWDKEGTFYPTVSATNLLGSWSTFTGPVYVQYILANALRVETRHVWALDYPDYTTEIVFDVFLVSEYIDMMPTNVTADVVFGDVDSNTQQQYTLSHQYLPDVAQFNTSLDKLGDRHVWTFSHNYTVGDTYTLKIDFQNWVSTLSVDVQFHAMEEVSPIQMHVKTIRADEVTVPAEALRPTTYLHPYVDCDTVYNMTGVPCVHGLRMLAGRWREDNPPSFNTNDTMSLYNPVPTLDQFKPPVSHLTFLEFLSGRNHLTEEEIQEMQLNAYQIRSGLSSTNAEKFDEFLAQIIHNPPLTMADLWDQAVMYAFTSQGLQDIIDVEAIQNWEVRQYWNYNSTLLLNDEYVADGDKLPDDVLYSYPQYDSVALYVTYERGTHLNFRWDWGDGTIEITDSPFNNHVYDRRGLYDCTVTVFNAKSHRNYTVTISVLRSVSMLEITGPEQATRNETTVWNFNLGTIGTDACYMMDFKDTGTERFPVDNRYYFIGDRPTCLQYFAIEMAVFPVHFMQRTNEQLEEEMEENGQVVISNGFTFGTLGTFRVVFKGKNRVSSEEVTIPVAVTKGPCFKPILVLKDNNPCEPDCLNGEPSILKADDVSLTALASYNCTTTTRAYHQWAITKVNTDGTEEMIEPDGISLYAPYYERPYRNLYLPARTLDYGRYLVSLNISMFDEDIWQMDSMYINIVKSPLVALLQTSPITTSFDRWKYETNYTLDALSYSYDPDVLEDDMSGWTFVWKCRRDCETMPVYDEDFNEVTPMTTLCNHYNKTYVLLEDGSEDRGCFINDGYLNSGLFTLSTEGIQTVDLTFAYELDYIIFEVEMYKDDRLIVQTLELNITIGMPPSIDPDICISNCKEKVNYEAIYSMSARIKRLAVYNYRWSLWKSHTPSFIDAEEIPQEEWEKNLPSDGSKPSMVETGRNSKSFALEPGFFTEEDTAYYFFVVVMAWRGNAIDNFGMVVSPFQVNEPPLRGNCSAFPLNGTAATTKFNANCTEFWDQHLPIRYQFGIRRRGDINIVFKSWRSTPTDPTGGIFLAAGRSDYNYEVELYVRAKDGIGGQTLSEPMIVQVNKLEVNLAEVSLDDFVSGDTSTDSDLIVAFAESASQSTEVEITVDIDSLSEEERAEYEARMEEERQKKMEEAILFRQSLSEQLTKLAMESNEDIASVTRGCASLTSNVNQTNDVVVNNAAETLGKAVVAANQTLKDTDAGTTQEISTSILDGTAECAAANEHQRKQQAEHPELKRKRREAGLASTDDIQLQLLEIVNSVSNTVSNKKVSGEGDTIIATSKMKMNVMKQFNDAFDGGKMASGGDGHNGIALPSTTDMLGSSNNTIQALSTMTNNFNELPFTPLGHDPNDNNTHGLPTGQLLQIVLKDEYGNMLDTANNNQTTPVSHIFMSRDEVPEPIISTNIAVKYGDDMIPHKIIVPMQSSIHVKMRRVFLENNSTGLNDTNITTTTMNPAVSLPSILPKHRSLRSIGDPFLSMNGTNSSVYDDLDLVFVLYFRAGIKPSIDVYDFNCTLPIKYYDIDDNTTVAIGGAISRYRCDDEWSESANSTCQTHTINRDIYPFHRSIVEYDDMACYIPDTWLDSYDSDLKLYIGVSHYFVNGTNMTSIPSNITMEDFSKGYMPQLTPVDIPPNEEETVYYEMEVSAASCKYWSPYHEDYINDGCEVGPLTQVNLTHCVCSILDPPIPQQDDTLEPEEYERKVAVTKGTPGITFASSLSIPINTINLQDSAFNNLGENPLVFSVMISLICLYMCSCVWAAAQDRKDAIKAGVSPLLDNDPRDRYLYEVTVYTGSRSGSSTTAKVSMVFSGDEDETAPRLIYDDKRAVLQSGGVDGFVMAVPRCLGNLTHIRVWHDNSGASPGWFFSRMQLVDMQSLEKYYFILDRWLSAGEDDGIIDRIVPLAGKDELTGFSHLFFTKAKKDLMDGHLWFSIFGKPHKSNFTRVQRLTCCLSLLFATMLGSIMLYRSPTEEQGNTMSIRLGPISLTVQQILKGILSSLISFPINLIIVLVFKNCKEPPYNLGKKCCAPTNKTKKKKTTDGFAADQLANEAKMLDEGEDMAKSTLSIHRDDDYSDWDGSDTNSAVKDYQNEEIRKRNQKFKLPWGFVFVAYFLALAVCGVAFWATIEIAGVFGPEKSAEWMASFCVSIVESIFMSQPIKVVCLALFFALVIKKPDSDEHVDPGLEKGEEYLHKHDKQCARLSANTRKKLHKYKNIPKPPTEEYLSAARALRQNEVKMMDVIKEVFLYLVFLYLLMMVSYGNRDPVTSKLYTSLYQEFHDADYIHGGVTLDSVTEYKSFWRYCNMTLLPSLWPDAWYDGVVRDKGFTADRNSYRVGVPRLRQLRMPGEQCAMPAYKMIEHCDQEYTLFFEDTGEYYPGWLPVTNASDADYGGPYPGWFWESSSDLDGFPFRGIEATYGGGGFNIELGYTKEAAQMTLVDLMENDWLTPETRAVIIEFVLYNPNSNLFAVSSMTFEFLPTGSVIPVYKMDLIRLDRYIGSFMITVMVSEILTFIYIIYYIYREVKVFKVQGKKYFNDFWNCIDFVTLTMCVGTLAMFFARFALVRSTAKELTANPESFVSFQFATTWEEIYGYLLSFIIFLANIKFLKLLRFNKRMTMLGMTMMYIGKPLLSFLLAWVIVFLAYAHMSYLIFSRLLKNFSTFIAASETLFTLMLNKFDYRELERANKFFAAFIFSSFTLGVSFILISFMVTIILDGFAQVTEELKHKENEYEIIDFLVSKFKGAIGLGTGPALPPMNKEPKDAVHETHAELMERFDDFEELFRDFCNDETKGDEHLVAKYERQIIRAKTAGRQRPIFASS